MTAALFLVVPSAPAVAQVETGAAGAIELHVGMARAANQIATDSTIVHRRMRIGAIACALRTWMTPRCNDADFVFPGRFWTVIVNPETDDIFG